MTVLNDLRLQDAPWLVELERRLIDGWHTDTPTTQGRWRSAAAQVRDGLLRDAAGQDLSGDRPVAPLPREASVALAWLSTEVPNEYVAGVASLLAFARGQDGGL